MLKLNKNKLIPATEIVASWGEIIGDISKQTDLVSLTTDLDTSIKEWVEDKGYLTEHQSLDGYATESWVSAQGYLTEHQDLSDYALKSEIPSLEGYATQNWVQSQGYLTEHQDLSDYTQKSEITPLYNKSEGYLKYVPSITYVEGMSNVMIQVPGVDTNNLQILCNTIEDKVYMYYPSGGRFFKFNDVTFTFDEYELSVYESTPTRVLPMWSDSQGRVYYGNSYMFYTIDDENKTVQLIPQDLGGDLRWNSGSLRSNIIKKDGVVYMISSMHSCAYIFNESTQRFDSSIPVQGTFPENNFFRYLTEFEGHWIYDAGSTQTELVFHLDAAEPYVEWVTLSERLFPGAWSYEYDGQTVNETTRSVYVHPVVKNGVTEYYTFGYANPVLYKLVNGAWEIVSYNQNIPDMTNAAGGCTCGTLWFGFGYQRNKTGQLIIWNMDDSAVTKPEFYGWYDVDSEIQRLDTRIDSTRAEVTQQLQMLYQGMSSLDTRVTALETNYGDALNITNQILG